MNYEKKYNEALERARNYYSTTDSVADAELIELIFPELKESESEDERIRKNCIHFLELQKTHHAATFEIEECIAWLEKQKELVSTDFDDVWEWADCDELTAPLEKYSKDAIKEMCHAWYDKGIELERKSLIEKQGEQKSTWSEKDESHLIHCIRLINNAEGCSISEQENAIGWLKSLKERMGG